jgi:hypothetical protein
VPTDPEQLPEQLQTRLADLEQEVSFLRAAAQAQSRRRHRDWDALAAVIASLVGLLALGISAYTAYVQREQLRAQVWPKLSLGQSNMLHKLYAGNQGVGPARVTAVRSTACTSRSATAPSWTTAGWRASARARRANATYPTTSARSPKSSGSTTDDCRLGMFAAGVIRAAARSVLDD